MWWIIEELDQKLKFQQSVNLPIVSQSMKILRCQDVSKALTILTIILAFINFQD